MRKTRRTERQRALLAYKQTTPIAIGPTREATKAYADWLEGEVIRAVRAWIWEHRSSCQLCHGRRHAECGGLPDEMHEEPSRAMTRGLPPWERFNISVCGRLCHACHVDVTAHRVWIVFDNPVHGFMGRVTTRAERSV